MIRFNNDYSRGAHPAVLEALARENELAFPGYGMDEWCQRAADLIRARAGTPSADVHFVSGGTQANIVVVSSALRPWESIVSADTGHIFNHEAGSIEHAGHKVLAVPSASGKLRAADVRRIVGAYYVDEEPDYLTTPRMVFISMATELGTVYTLSEMEELREVCDEFGLYLYVDGARMPYAIQALGGDVTLEDVGRLADIFYCGGTKCGALFGEAIVVGNDTLKSGLRRTMKQAGAVLAKGWLTGLQFATLFEGDLYFKLAARANAQAALIASACKDAGVPLLPENGTNQVFMGFRSDQIEALSRSFALEPEGVQGDLEIVRACTSWSTSDADVNELVEAIRHVGS